jgi:hypothetical protein
VAFLLVSETPLRFKRDALRNAAHVLRFTFHVFRLRALRQVLISAALAFALASPWALLRPVAAWRGPSIQVGLVAGRFDVPYTRQYAGTLSFVYPLIQMTLWGLGPLLTVSGLLGLGWGGWHWRHLIRAQRVTWLWTTVFFVATAGLYVKFPRYLLPIYPAWAAWATTAAQILPHKTPATSHISRFTFHVLLTISTAVLGLAQLAMYAQPHPWAEASRWLYANVPSDSTVAVEQWDHPLPVPMPAGDPGRFTTLTLPVFDEASAEKVQALEAAQTADVVVLASRRGYGALARQPERYAATLAWYENLVKEREAIVFARCPRFGPVALTDDPLVDAGLPTPPSWSARCGTRWTLRLPRLDESFRVYDAPIVVLLVR